MSDKESRNDEFESLRRLPIGPAGFTNNENNNGNGKPAEKPKPDPEPTKEASTGPGYTDVGLDNIIPTVVRMMSSGITQRTQIQQNQVYHSKQLDALNETLSTLNETLVNCLVELQKLNRPKE